MFQHQDYNPLELMYESNNYHIYRARRRTDQQSVLVKTLVDGQPIKSPLERLWQEYEILGKFDGGSDTNKLDLAKPVINGKSTYKRIAIRKRGKIYDN